MESNVVDKERGSESAGAPRQRSERSLNAREKTIIALLGVPTFALALATTVVTTYLPLIAKRFTGSTTIIGLIIGIEGMLALVLPLMFGAWSDQLRTRIGGRLPFVLGAAPGVAASVALLGVVPSLWTAVLLVLAFFTAYFIAYEPYRALYPDLVSGEVAGRAQSIQALWRGAGTGLALVGGGLLFAAARWLPFVVAATVFVVAVATFAMVLLRRGVPAQESHVARGLRQAAGELRHLIGAHPALRAYLFANAMWELSLSAIKTFVILFLTVGLGKRVGTAALIVGAVAAVILISAPISGQLADRLGRLRILRIALWAYGLGLFIPLLTQKPCLVAPAILPIAFGGAVVMSLPYAILMPLMPARSHGALTGFYSLSRGIGTTLGPVLAGAAIELLRSPLPSTHGYAAMWGVAGASVLISIYFLGKLRGAESDRRALRGEAHGAEAERN